MVLPSISQDWYEFLCSINLNIMFISRPSFSKTWKGIKEALTRHCTYINIYTHNYIYFAFELIIPLPLPVCLCWTSPLLYQASSWPQSVLQHDGTQFQWLCGDILPRKGSFEWFFQSQPPRPDRYPHLRVGGREIRAVWEKEKQTKQKKMPISISHRATYKYKGTLVALGGKENDSQPVCTLTVMTSGMLHSCWGLTGLMG